MLCLNIRSTDARIGLNIDRGHMDIHSPRGHWNRQTEQAQSNLSVGETIVEWDSTPFYEALGRYKPAALYRKYAQEGRQGVSAGVSSHLQAAEMFNKQKPGENVIAALGRQALETGFEIVVGFDLTPKLDIRVQPGKLQGSNDVGSLKQEYQAEPIQFNYTPTTVNTYLEQQGSIQMWVTDGKYDIYA